MSGVIIGIPCYLKSDAPIHIENWITQMRADPAFYNLPFKIVSTIITDGAGEWSRNSRKWKAALMRIKMTEVIYVTPETSKEAGLSERANCILEEAIKAIMMEQNLPEDHWEVCSSNAIFLLNRFPNLAGDSTAPIDGDQALPLEILTRGHYSRRQLYRELSYFVQIGTPALVHAAKIKGSTLAPKVRWGVAWGMYREQVVWRCPFTHSTFRSKSFTAFELRDNLNYAQFLGLPEMETTRKGVAIQGDINEDISIWLQPAMPASAAHQQPVVSIQSANEQAVQYIKLPAPQEAQDPPDGPLDKGGEATEINTETCPELGGSDHDVTTLGNTQDQVYNTGQQLNTGPQEGITAQQQDYLQMLSDSERFETLLDEHNDQQAEERDRDTDFNIAHPLKPTDTEKREPRYVEAGALPEQLQTIEEWDQDWNDRPDLDHSDTDTDSESDNEDDEALDMIASILSEREALQVGINLSFAKLCKHYEIPHELHDLYHEWLVNLKQGFRPRFNHLEIPRGRGQYIKPGLKIPAPCGSEWRERVKAKGLKQGNFNKRNVTEAYSCVIQAMHTTHEALRAVESLTRHWDEQEIIEARAAKKVKKQRVAKASEGATPPQSITKALRSEDRAEAFKWLESINSEWDGLCKLGVLDHNYTSKQLREAGITTKPIPFSVSLKYKFDEQGEVSRYKTRMALAGHRGNMQPGVHFDRTYSSTPVQHSTKILQALMVRLKLSRLAFDIKQAFCQAELPEDQKIAIRYPEGFRRYAESGEELFMILRRNLYGHPAAGRIWEKERNVHILEIFNKEGWTCKRCVKEPCMFVIKDPQGKRVWMLVWTDDCDCVGEGDEVLNEVFKRINAKWESKIVDASYILGMKRTVTNTDTGAMEVELSMTAFVESMGESFKEYVSKRTINTPLTPGFSTSIAVKSTEEENKRVLNRGFQRLFGTLLWAARGCFPECLEGCSTLGRVMSKPTEGAWEQVCHMMNYMLQHKNNSIKYSSEGNLMPIVFVDASNKADPADSKCQYGYTHLWMGGTVIAVSKKLAHVGLSAAHNEYMAAHWANRHTAWLRDLMEEMEIKEIGTEPTVTYADNRAANLLCEEDIITCGNQFMQVPYHYNKEAIKMGVVVMRYIPTVDNLADILTKAVSRQVLERLLPAVIGQRAPLLPSIERAHH
jgi:hypothetical protein